MNLDGLQVRSHRLLSLGVLFSNLKPPYLKKAPHTGLLTVMCIFESESQMLRSGYFEGEILSLTTVAMVEPGEGGWRHAKHVMCIISLHLRYITLNLSSPPLFQRCGKLRA